MSYEKVLFKMSKVRYRKYHNVCDMAIRYTDEGPDLCRSVDKSLWQDCVENIRKNYERGYNERVAGRNKAGASDSTVGHCGDDCSRRDLAVKGLT